MNATINDTARAWVGCLSCYNEGILEGEWLDADEAVEWKCPRPVTIYNLHEETWCFDMEGLPSSLMGEMSPVSFKELVDSLADVDDLEAYDAYVNHVGAHYATPEGFEEDFAGEWESLAEYAEDFAESCGYDRPQGHNVSGHDRLTDTWPFSHIDWEAAGEALEVKVVEVGYRRCFIFNR